MHDLTLCCWVNWCSFAEETYDYAYFDNQVLEFNFPGHPAPPLGTHPSQIDAIRADYLTKYRPV